MTIDEEFDWYLAKRDDINAGHVNEFVAIKDHSVLGYFPTLLDAFDGTKDHKPGTYMIHQCTQGEEYVAHFYNGFLANLQ